METIVPPHPADLSPRDDAARLPEATALTALYDRIVDSVKGYTKMVEKAEPSFRDTAEKFRALHARHASDVEPMLAAVGVEADRDGTLMGTVNQAVVTFRAFFDDIDEDVMDQVRSGEDWVLNAFDDAIDEQALPTETAKLRAMRTELGDLLEETRDLG